MSFQRWTVWNEDCYYWGSETKQEWHCTLTWWNTWLHGETHISMVIHMITWWNTYFLVKHMPSWSIKMFAPIFLHGYICHIRDILQLFRHFVRAKILFWLILQDIVWVKIMFWLILPDIVWVKHSPWLQKVNAHWGGERGQNKKICYINLNFSS